jgi:hypothetical protein
MTAQQPQHSFAFSAAPIMKIYLDSLEAWKQNYEALTMPEGEGHGRRPAYEPVMPKPAYDTGFGNWQKSGEETFRRFVESQMEVCRFFASRWESYLKLPAQLAHCQTPAQIAQVQAGFLSQCAGDYMQEAAKLSQSLMESAPGFDFGRH